MHRPWITADMGNSGANFIVAETGMISSTENEGNARSPVADRAGEPLSNLLPKGKTEALFCPSMHLLRVILALLIASAFPLAANECLLAAAFPAAITDCCGGHPEPAENGAPDSDCANCAMMETGVNPAAVAAFAAGAVEWRENVLLSARLRAALAVVEKEAPSVVPESPPEVRSLWPSLVRTALPVRGPSFA